MERLCEIMNPKIEVEDLFFHIFKHEHLIPHIKSQKEGVPKKEIIKKEITKEEKKAVFSLFIYRYLEFLVTYNEIIDGFAEFLKKKKNRECLNKEAFHYLIEANADKTIYMATPVIMALNALFYAVLEKENEDAKHTLRNIIKEHFAKDYKVVKKWNSFKIDNLLEIINVEGTSKPFTQSHMYIQDKNGIEEVFGYNPDKHFEARAFYAGDLSIILTMLYLLDVPGDYTIPPTYEFLKKFYEESCKIAGQWNEEELYLHRDVTKECIAKQRIYHDMEVLKAQFYDFENFYDLFFTEMDLINDYGKTMGLERDIIWNAGMTKEKDVDFYYLSLCEMFERYQLKHMIDEIGPQGMIGLAVALHGTVFAARESERIQEYIDTFMNAIAEMSEENEKEVVKPISSLILQEKYEEVEKRNAELELRLRETEKTADKKDARIKELEALLKEEKDKQIKVSKTDEEFNAAFSELIALRDHVYNMTENTAEEYIPAGAPADMNEFLEKIGNKSVCLFGGNPNWVYKLKNKFPKWKFYKAEMSGIDEAAIKNADYVYFFTGCMRHSNYNKTISLMKEHDIPFGYISNINIDKNVQQFYMELKHLL